MFRLPPAEFAKYLGLSNDGGVATHEPDLSATLKKLNVSSPFLPFSLSSFDSAHPNSLLFFFGQDIERGFSSPDEGRAYRVSSTCLLFPVVPLPIPFSASSPPSPFFSSSSSRKSSLRSTSPQLSTPSNLEDSVTSTSSFPNSSLKVGTPSSFGTSESVEGKPLSCIDTQQTFSQSSASTWIS